jgi:hypothetical protein
MEVSQTFKKLSIPTGDSVKVKLSSFGIWNFGIWNIESLIGIGLCCLVIVSLDCLVVWKMGMVLCLGVLLLSKFKELKPNDVQNLSI